MDDVDLFAVGWSVLKVIEITLINFNFSEISYIFLFFLKGLLKTPVVEKAHFW